MVLGVVHHLVLSVALLVVECVAGFLVDCVVDLEEEGVTLTLYHYKDHILIVAISTASY